MTIEEIKLLPESTYIKLITFNSKEEQIYCLCKKDKDFSMKIEYSPLYNEDLITITTNLLFSIGKKVNKPILVHIDYINERQFFSCTCEFDVLSKEEAKEINEYLYKVKQIEQVKPFQFPKQYIANKDVYFMKKGDILEIAKDDLYSVVGGDPKKFIHAEIVENNTELFTEIK